MWSLLNPTYSLLWDCVFVALIKDWYNNAKPSHCCLSSLFYICVLCIPRSRRNRWRKCQPLYSLCPTKEWSSLMPQTRYGCVYRTVQSILAVLTEPVQCENQLVYKRAKHKQVIISLEDMSWEKSIITNLVHSMLIEMFQHFIYFILISYFGKWTLHF